MVKFTDEERSWLIGIVVDWINDGFTTPPYNDEVYSIFEKLGIHNDVPFPLQYDVERPEVQSLSETTNSLEIQGNVNKDE